MTSRLYYDDSFLLGFRARVVGHASWNGAPSVVLDRTAFYPESGGQMADRGLLGGTAVVDVQVDDAGVVHHVLGGPLPAVGDEVDATIDRERRRVHMALHTGQHMLSRALLDVAGGETVSSRLGETACTIDLDLAKMDERDVARAEDLTNAVIDDDVTVRAYFPAPGELAALPLRRAPKVEDNVRVVQIGEFDVSPCGGTHCLRSGQVGLLRIGNVERYKGKVRVTFAAGRRARRELGELADVLTGLGRELTCGPGEVPTALAKLRRELAESREALGQARASVAGAAAAALLAGDADPIVRVFDDLPIEGVRMVAKRVTEAGRVAVLGAAGPDGIHVIVARPARSTFDCGAHLRRLAAAAGGRGGGSPERAEGRLPLGAKI
ncbi:MAG TPA: alanyl-tRNA editing protein [Haliangiales bacterium]|nr:alanyl-tRNA editing protein [Haliangiales bacterium]